MSGVERSRTPTFTGLQTRILLTSLIWLVHQQFKPLITRDTEVILAQPSPAEHQESLQGNRAFYAKMLTGRLFPTILSRKNCNALLEPKPPMIS
jgi:hypothetical protein